MPKERQSSHGESFDDISRLEEWMDSYGQDVIHLAYSYLHNYHKAEDVAQDVFLRAWRNWDTFQGQSSVKTWLLSITANRCKDHLRSWSAKHEVSDDGVIFHRIPVSDTESQVTARLEQDRLWGIVNNLPEKYREVVVLYYQRDLSGQEIAEVLGISEQAVRTRLHRGRQLLKSQLREEEMGFL
ncbi:sigma-70 family RNA polymerase sigma factor [Alicyclobacillus dauci]|uniref:RNA polymerase sigma factor n=1 Tax=Alicyclobacillus dauci TaxID=1475485 RepID=A0ABY6YZE2_9BACL|nr:sigma-70 family RNA polymerase sigma factor [Alicyclobacillus dauci]WAH35827.1 sigma-70 family RNA polymerase sigma factor [Alicyclobacillus dauci]